MPFIQLQDGIVIEVQVGANDPQEVDGALVKLIPNKTIQDSLALLPKIVAGVGSAFKDFYKALDVPIKVGEAEVDLGLSFSLEGNVYLAKAKGEGTLNVKIKFTPLEEQV